MRTMALTAAAHAGAAATTSGAQAGAVRDFDKGRTIRFALGAGPGGGYDLCARTPSQHMAAKISCQKARKTPKDIPKRASKVLGY